MRDKIFERRQLLEVLTQRRAAPGVSPHFVFTNGCFDLLHVGHSRYLAQAAAQGDGLIVALNDDASIQRLKGPERPILKLDERLQVMAGLACVDYVTWFTEDTPIPLLRELRPELLVKGGTYGRKGIVGHDIVSEWGGQAIPLVLTEGLSTSNLIETVLKQR